MKENFSCGNRIRELRNERGLSQEQLALAAEITPAYLGLVERGKRNATVAVIERLCFALNLSLAEFFSDSTVSTSELDSVEKQILGQIAMLNDDEKVIALQMMKALLQFRTSVIRNHIQEQLNFSFESVS